MKGFPISSFAVPLNFALESERYLVWLDVLFFLILWRDLRELLLTLVVSDLLQKKTSNKTKKIQSYDRKFVAKQYIKSLEIYYDIDTWEKSVTSDAEMERWLTPAEKSRTVDYMLV